MSSVVVPITEIKDALINIPWMQQFNPLLHRLFFRPRHYFLFLDNIEKSPEKMKLVLNTFEIIMENGAFAPKEQMLHFP